MRSWITNGRKINTLCSRNTDTLRTWRFDENLYPVTRLAQHNTRNQKTACDIYKTNEKIFCIIKIIRSVSLWPNLLNLVYTVVLLPSIFLKTTWKPKNKSHVTQSKWKYQVSPDPEVIITGFICSLPSRHAGMVQQTWWHNARVFSALTGLTRHLRHY